MAHDGIEQHHVEGHDGIEHHHVEGHDGIEHHHLEGFDLMEQCFVERAWNKMRKCIETVVATADVEMA